MTNSCTYACAIMMDARWGHIKADGFGSSVLDPKPLSLLQIQSIFGRKTGVHFC